MSFSKTWCFALLAAVVLAPACVRKSETAVLTAAAVHADDDVAPVAEATAVACSGILFNDQCVNKGDTVTFGKYPQATSTAEDIEWIVLDVDSANSRMLLLSRYVLDAKSYHTENVFVTWEKCSLRTWLNNDFLNAAFGNSEQAKILLSHLNNPGNPYFYTTGGNATDDKVFLLTIADVISKTNEYFSSDEARVAMADFL